ncbi:MAG: hypothetical protein ACJ8GK_01020, partial [Luteimonas sp.]
PSLARLKTAHIHVRRPYGVSRVQSQANGDGEQSNENSLLLVTHPQAASNCADPEGAAHGWAAFSAEPWMASRKIPMSVTHASELCGESCFLLVTFLCSTQRKVTRAQRESV